jgi:hypothetical protein
MMATTNGTFDSQTFGISFGTSDCRNDGQVMAACKSDMFAASTFESLSEDMERGQGEHLVSLATLGGVPVEHQPAFFSLAQDRYRTLMEKGKIHHSQSARQSKRRRLDIHCLPVSRRGHK